MNSKLKFAKAVGSAKKLRNEKIRSLETKPKFDQSVAATLDSIVVVQSIWTSAIKKGDSSDQVFEQVWCAELFDGTHKLTPSQKPQRQREMVRQRELKTKQCAKQCANGTPSGTDGHMIGHIRGCSERRAVCVCWLSIGEWWAQMNAGTAHDCQWKEEMMNRETRICARLECERQPSMKSRLGMTHRTGSVQECANACVLSQKSKTGWEFFRFVFNSNFPDIKKNLINKNCVCPLLWWFEMIW